MGCGVRKSGSPISRWITSWPRASTSRARVWISITSKGSMWAIRAAVRNLPDVSFIPAMSASCDRVEGERDRREHQQAANDAAQEADAEERGSTLGAKEG